MSHFSLFSQYHIELEPSEEVIFRKFLDLFLEYNAHTNLSAIRTPEGIVEKHFIDSLMLGNAVELHGKVLDIGSGGGFPGIPLKILFPEVDFTLMDSVGKKVRAMNHFIEWLGLTGIKAVQARAEEVAKLPEYKRQFDFIVSRATAYLPQILEWAEPFLAKDGQIILYKLASPDELAEGKQILKRLGLRLVGAEDYTIGEQERVFLIFERI
ncbi:MAG: Ribosomal RNA small subunit methyltransferase G [uncultured bacterium (gcode 4)]|uniref:Ribosomal RNA small subunit methyltransferase G n=1 Tax=uncultured bacterium (gcode 4) TaxID=1234023 RepID=K1YXV5_9BACT|nr:MAG: Ribosomal RNA small subunit methyltransferase G [uncultured bacterium (gcode 4)]